MRFFHKFALASEGSALLEATLVFPLCLSLMVGASDFGREFWTDHTLEKSTRDAARYLASIQQQTGCSSWAITNAQNLAVYGTISPPAQAQPLIAGWQPGDWTNPSGANNVAIDCSSFPTIRVTGNVPFTYLMLAAVVPGFSTSTRTFSHEETYVGD